MTSQPPGEQKIRRLRNDVDDIYDLLGELRGTVDQHTATLNEHTVILNEHGTKLDRILDLLEPGTSR